MKQHNIEDNIKKLKDKIAKTSKPSLQEHPAPLQPLKIVQTTLQKNTNTSSKNFLSGRPKI